MGSAETNDLSPLETLLAIEEIKTLKARYFRLMDTKQFDEMYDLFVEDARVVDMAEPAFEGELEAYRSPDAFEGAAAFIEALRGEGPTLRTAHHGHMPEIEITSADTARGIWAMFDFLEWPQEWAEVRELPEGQSGIKGFGHYHEEYRRDDDGAWKISRMTLTRIRVDRQFSSGKEN